MADGIVILSISKRYIHFFNYITNVAEFVGANVLKDSFRLTWLTWTVISFITAYFAFSIYTIYVGLAIDNDWSVILLSLCYAGTAMQGTAKLTSAILNRPDLCVLRTEIEDIYIEYELKGDEYQECLKQSLALSKKILYVLLNIYCLTSLGLICVPLYHSIFLREKVHVMQFAIPGIDANTDFGFVIHQVMQVTCISFGAFGNFASDCLCFMIVAHIPLLKNIMVCKFHDLDETLRKNPINAKQSARQLKDIFMWHQKYMKFCKVLKDCFFWVIFVQFVTATNSIVCTIVCHFLAAMPTAPVFLIYCFIIMYSYCALGNLVEISNDDVIKAIYDSLWYKMSVAEQKMLLIMFREAQKSKGMSIGGISPLSLNTGLQLTKTIYTIAMILNEFFY